MKIFNTFDYEMSIFANSQRMNFMKPKRERSSDRGRSVSGLKEIHSLAVGGFIS
ncbi:MAG: hypothetical protein AAB514_02690 [Patescibacteria group bacterium]